MALRLSFVSKNRNSKHQNTNKFQTSSTKLQINHKYQEPNYKHHAKGADSGIYDGPGFLLSIYGCLGYRVLIST